MLLFTLAGLPMNPSDPPATVQGHKSNNRSLIKRPGRLLVDQRAPEMNAKLRVSTWIWAVKQKQLETPGSDHPSTDRAAQVQKPTWRDSSGSSACFVKRALAPSGSK